MVRRLFLVCGLLASFALVPSALAGGALAASDSRLVLVSRVGGLAGEPGDAAQAVAISANGRYAAFASGTDLFIRDLRTHRTRRLGEGSSLVFSADTEFLVHGSGGKLFVRNLDKGTRSLVTAQLLVSTPSISANGRFVVFGSTNHSLSDQGHSPYQVYLHDLKRKTTTLVSRARGVDGAIGDGESSDPSISANGRFVAFSFTRFGGPSSVLVRDLRTGAAVNASLLTRNPLKPAFGTPAISANGRFVAFRAASPEGIGLERLYLVDLQSRRTKYVGEVSTNEGGPLSFSANGRYLLFDTFVDSNVPKGSEPLIPASGEVYRYTNPFLP